MNIKLLPAHEVAILSMAAKIRGSRGGKNVTQKRITAIRKAKAHNAKKAA